MGEHTEKKIEKLTRLSDSEIIPILLKDSKSVKNLVLLSFLYGEKKSVDVFDFLLTKAEFVKALGLTLEKICHAIIRIDRNTGLLNEGLVESVNEEEKIYRITDKGVSYLYNIYDKIIDVEEEELTTSVIIRRFDAFFDDSRKYNVRLLEAIRTKKNFLIIDFNDILKYDVEISEELLENPKETFECIVMAIRNRYEIDESKSPFMIRIKNLPKSSYCFIKDIRNEYLNKLISFDGVIRQKSNVVLKVVTSKWECPSCGRIFSIIHRGTYFTEPKNNCGCGRKGKFRLLSTTVIDYQEIELEELPEFAGNEQPRRLKLILKGDLTLPITDSKTNPGMPVRTTGIIKSNFVEKRRKRTNKLTYYFNVSNVEPLEDRSVILSEADIKEIRELSKNENIIERLTFSFSPSIKGMKQIKYALLLARVGGCKKKKDDITVLGLINLLIIGDPGKAKSQLLIRGNEIATKSKYITGQTTSGPGLGATVVKSKLLDDMWSIESGVLPLCNDGQCWIDELSRMHEDDRNWLYEAMTQGSITINKASVHCCLKAEVSIIAGCNPKFDRFNPNEILATQLGLPPALINRFDLIFPVVDIPDKMNDTAIAEHILSLHTNTLSKKDVISTNTLRKYLSFASELQPVFTEESSKLILNYYVKLRISQKPTSEGEHCPIPCNERQLQALVRLTEANAKLRLAEKTNENDARMSIKLIDTQLKLLGLDPLTGKIDIDKISSSVFNYERQQNIKIKDILERLSDKFHDGVPVEEILKIGKEKGYNEYELDRRLKKLTKLGDIYENRRGFYQTF